MTKSKIYARSITWIEASAGSGKTTFIVNKIKDLLESGVAGSSILCLSFTNSAANELKARFTDTNNLPNFYTIHGFAMSMLPNQKGLRLIDEATKSGLIHDAIEIEYDSKFEPILERAGIGLNSLQTIMEEYIKGYSYHSKTEYDISEPRPPEINLSEAARKTLKEKNLSYLADVLESGDPELYIKHIVTTTGKLNESLLNRLSACKEMSDHLNQAYDYTMHYLELKGIHDAIEVNLIMLNIASRYYQIVKMRNMLHYDDILKLAMKKPDAAKMMQIKHIFLDEAQDTSAVQVSFLNSIFAELSQHDEYSITVVGDKKQLIYGFNGSSENVFKKLQNYLIALANDTGALWLEERLTNCYRCGKTILNFVDRVMHNSSYSCAHTAAKQLKSKVGIWQRAKVPKHQCIHEVPESQGMSAAINFYVTKIKELKTKKLLNEDRLVEDSDIFIIIPKRCIGTYLLAYELVKNGITVAEAPFIVPTNGMMEEFTHIAEFAIIQNDISVLAILKGPFFQWTNSDIENLCLNRGNTTVWEQLSAKTDSKCVHATKIMAPWIEWPRQAGAFYAKLFFTSEYGEYVRGNVIEEVEVFWDKVLDVKNMNLADFINHIQNGVRNFAYNRKGLSILTIHAAKGRENNVVFLFNSHLSPSSTQQPYILHKNLPLFKGIYPSYKRLKNSQRTSAMRESERLRYVTMTRASTELYIFPPMEYENIAHNSLYARLLECIDFKDHEYIELTDEGENWK